MSESVFFDARIMSWQPSWISGFVQNLKNHPKLPQK